MTYRLTVKGSVLASLILIGALHLLSILVMAGWYVDVPRELFGLGVVLGPALQVAGFLVSIVLLALSKDLRRSIAFGVLSAIAIGAFIHGMLRSPY